MNVRSRTVWRTWRRLRRRSRAETAYALYVAAWLVLLIGGPLARAMWLIANDDAWAAAVSGGLARPALEAMLAMGWTAAALVGHLRGPVVVEPALAHTLAFSAIRQRSAFARAAVVAIAWCAVLGVAAAFVLLLSSRFVGVDGLHALDLLAGGIGAGVLGGVCWLCGQALRSMSPLLVVVGGATVGLAMSFVPSPTFGAGLVVLGVAAVALLFVPALLDRLDPVVVDEQSQRWAAARAGASMLELTAVSATYESLPYRGRRWAAVRPSPSAVLMLARSDAVASARTPRRLVWACCGLVSSGALLSAAIASSSSGWGFGALAGLIAFAAVSPLLGGIRHAADVASSLPLYGVKDSVLLASHAVFPLVAAAALVLVGSFASSFAERLDPVRCAGAALVLVAGVLAVRIMGALKPPLPIALMTPVPTPAGDLGAFARFLWAVDGLVLAALVGAGAAWWTVAPWLAICVVLVASAIAWRRWAAR